jgi:hypothetical protein
LAGFYSEFGPALALVDTADDESAIIGPGEEIELRFRAALERPSPRQTRYYVFEAQGWCKDHDLFTRDGETVAPAPRRTEQQMKKSKKLPKKSVLRYRSGN